MSARAYFAFNMSIFRQNIVEYVEIKPSQWCAFQVVDGFPRILIPIWLKSQAYSTTLTLFLSYLCISYFFEQISYDFTNVDQIAQINCFLLEILELFWEIGHWSNAKPLRILLERIVFIIFSSKKDWLILKIGQ